ncbi:DUF1592 domain-containing protein [Verrucomicrobiales bacterium BCK34]|nr:DUF1592 domain-containing protein [Verrucomicrobiales bacterium BCK34]
MRHLKRSDIATFFISPVLGCAFAVSAHAADGFTKKIEPFFEKHCYECHDDLTKKGGLDIYALSQDLSDPAALDKWIYIYDRVAKGEMPPKDRNAPSTGEKRIFASELAPSLSEAHSATKQTVLRRLNRREYQNTINELLGVRIDAESYLPEDGRADGFDNVGEQLGMSKVQLRYYIDLATKALDEAVALNPDTENAPETVTASYAETRGAEKFIGESWLKAPDGAIVFFQDRVYPTGMLREAHAPTRGFYRIKVTGYAYQSDNPITFSIGGTSFARASEKPIYAYRSLPPGKPTTVEISAWMDERYMIEIKPQGIYDNEYLINREGIANYKGPGLAISSVEITGPIIDEIPSRGYQLIFEGLDRKEIEPRNPADREKSWYVPKFEIVSESPTDDVIPVLHRFANAAFRRPASEEKVAPYLILFQSELAKGESFEEALLTALAAMLCSPDFLYLNEMRKDLDDFELASRLSYFLTRNAPDGELLAAAATGELSKSPELLLSKADRLMQGEDFERFITDFTDGWLDLRSIDFTNPDERLFPEFDRYLQFSMIDETRSFFREMLNANLPVSTIVKSDFAMLNSRLADHYGIDGVTNPVIERVSLPAHSNRGGILSHGSILKVSANGTNTSPVLRGVWINERILGQHPAPPPAGIPGVEPDIRGAETLREILEKHKNSENCQSCHTMIDPPGFALESFNPIGGWRDRFRSLGEGEKVDLKMVRGKPVRYKIGQPVDSSGALPDGTSFTNFQEYQNLLADDPDKLAKNLATKLLVFATGREMGFSDRPEINEIVRKSAETGHGVRDLIQLVISSQIFRQK